MKPEQLKTLRLDRRWKLRDVAVPLGVTEATLSRWERGLQTPPENLQTAWERILTGKRPTTSIESQRRRRPRGVVPRLAELFLADVTAGVNGWEAGWRDLAELGVTTDDLPTLESDIEQDGQGRIRIHFESRLHAVQQAKDILGYRKTLRAEEARLLPALTKLVRPVLDAVRSPSKSDAILLAGLTEMVNMSADHVQTARNWLDNDPMGIVEAPQGAAIAILEGVGISPPDEGAALVRADFQDLMPPAAIPEKIEQARAVAKEIGLDRTARRLGTAPVTALAAAWAVNRRLMHADVGITTDEGARQLGEAFWDWLGRSRAEIDAAWRRIMIDEFEPQTEQEQLGMLFWSWPEVL